MALTSEQLDSFLSEGYCKIPGIIPPPLLERLRQLFDELMYKDEFKEQRSYYFANGQDHVTNLENLCHKGNLAALELLGSPFMLEIAAHICGPDFFLIQEFAVIKNAGDELPVLWHQDMMHERTGRCFTVGIYLDEVKENDGALRVVPGSHLSGKSICVLQHEPFIEVPMQAGDILIHDMMLAHASEPMRQQSIRRVLYFEFLSRTQVLQEKIYTEALINNRTRLLAAAMFYYQKLHPEEKPFVWEYEGAASFLPVTNLPNTLKQIYSMPINARVSTYCFEHQTTVPG